MSAVRLDTKYVAKPWGRTDLPAHFPDGAGERIGEVWFDGAAGQDLPLLVKYIFTSDRLSVQVHPDDAQAAALGVAGGKSECWLILDAVPDARLGMGTTNALDAATLRAAALDGSIEQLMDWKPVRAGDFFYIPAGTVHAIGGGISLVEVQQNNDVTFRLFDYGRPRALHLDDGVAVSRAVPYARAPVNLTSVAQARLLDRSEAPFVLDLATLAPETQILGAAGLHWFVPLTGKGDLEGQSWEAGQCWLLDGPVTLTPAIASRALIAHV
jgi:mannose-6-phosphate isomerase